MLPKDPGTRNIRDHPPKPKAKPKKKPYSPPATSTTDAASSGTRPRRPKPTPKPGSPSKRAVRIARAQEQAFASQGRDVEREANRQKAARKARQGQSDAAQMRSNDKQRRQAYIRSTYPKKPKPYEQRAAREFPALPRTEAVKALARKHPELQAGAGGKQAEMAPISKVLEQTTRPLHASAGAAREEIKQLQKKGLAKGALQVAQQVVAPGPSIARNKPILREASKGIQNKTKYTYSDVLKQAGVKNKAIRAIGGFAGDVAFDPTTGVTFGTGTVARKAALAAGEHAAERGITVKIAGTEVKGVTKATAVAGRPIKKAAEKLPGRATARAIASEVSPNVARAGVSKEEHAAVKQLARTRRSATSHGVHVGQLVASGVTHAIGKAGARKGLPKAEKEALTHQNLQQVRDALSAGLEHATAAPKAAEAARPGIASKQLSMQLGHEPAPLFYHAKKPPEKLTIRSKSQQLRLGAQHAAPKAPRRAVKSGVDLLPAHLQGHARELQKILKDTNAAAERTGGKQLALSSLRNVAPTELHRVIGEHIASTYSHAARVDFSRRLAAMGREVKPGTAPKLKEGESVYVLTKSGEIQKAAEGATGKKVILKDAVVETAKGQFSELGGPGIVHTFDRATGKFKRIAIGTPGFHLRNIVGDLSNAYLGQAGHRIPQNIVHGARTLKAYGRAEKALKNLTPAEVGKATLNTPKYGKVTYDELAAKLRDAGAFRSGYISREVPELSLSGGRHSTLPKPVQAVGHAIEHGGMAREDLPRLTTAIEILRRGGTYEEAADAVAHLHFDYQDLSKFERNAARRFMPFYTWTARNVPLQNKMLLQKPGKFANFEKVREEAVKATGVEDRANQARATFKQLEQAGADVPKDWQKSISVWEQRAAAIPVKWKGGIFTVSAGLPIQDLNEFPQASLNKQMTEYFDKGASMLNPFLKMGAELRLNMSLFFHDQLERDHSPLVQAPAWAKFLPKDIQKAARLGMYMNNKTGKKTLQWRGKADYLMRAVPGTPQYINSLLARQPGPGSKTLAQMALNWTGVKTTEVNPLQQALTLAYQRRDAIDKELVFVRKAGAGKDNPTPRWRKLSDQRKLLNQIIYQTEQKIGYKKLPTTGGPPKVRGGGGIEWGGGAGSSVQWGSSGSDVVWGP